MKKRQTSKSSKDLAPAGRIALGYTLFAANSSGQPVELLPNHVLKNGDRVRALIESNVDGHLYVFNQEADGVLRLLFPDLRTRRGSARITAHVPVELPGPSAENGQDWFILSGAAHSERLILVLSLTPAEGWPSERALLDYPSGFSISTQEFDRVTAKPSSSIKQKVDRDNDRQTGRREFVRAPRISSKTGRPVSVVTSSSGAQRVILRLELRTDRNQ